MRRSICALAVSLCFASGCTQPSGSASANDANAGLDSVNARLVRAYHDRDPHAYASLYTDSAQFEWPAIATVRGRAGLESMARSGWPSLPELRLKLIVSSRRLAPNHATELGAFEESWRDSSGARTTEFGRYVTVFARQGHGGWRMDRFFGFEDSTRAAARR